MPFLYQWYKNLSYTRVKGYHIKSWPTYGRERKKKKKPWPVLGGGGGIPYIPYKSGQWFITETTVLECVCVCVCVLHGLIYNS